jgi:hypothetical protein
LQEKTLDLARGCEMGFLEKSGNFIKKRQLCLCHRFFAVLDEGIMRQDGWIFILLIRATLRWKQKLTYNHPGN